MLPIITALIWKELVTLPWLVQHAILFWIKNFLTSLGTLAKKRKTFLI
jgi:hypothetical protein